MNCKEVKKYLDAYLDGELAPDLLLDVDGHLEGCETCGSVVLVKRRFKSELLALGEIKAPEHLRMRIGRLPKQQSRRRIFIGAIAVPAAAAAALIVVLNFPDGATPEEPLAAVVDDVVARHVRQLPLEVEGADPVQTASWFRGKVDFPVNASGLKLKQASLQGARLSNVREHQAAQMTYIVDGHRVTLMIFNRRDRALQGGRRVKVGNKDVLLGRHNGFNVAVLLDGDMAYALSSDLSQNKLIDLIKGI
jgi:anti-sigma factor RsiW